MFRYFDFFHRYIRKHLVYSENAESLSDNEISLEFQCSYYQGSTDISVGRYYRPIFAFFTCIGIGRYAADFRRYFFRHNLQTGVHTGSSVLLVTLQFTADHALPLPHQKSAVLPDWAVFRPIGLLLFTSSGEKIPWAGVYNLGCFCPRLASFLLL